jgi:alpha-N-acetylglucosaminidase
MHARPQRRSAALILSLIAGVAASLTAVPNAAAAAPAFDTSPATAALRRLLPDQAAQFTLVAQKKTGDDDAFSVSGPAGAVRVQGTSPATLLAGVGAYLRQVAHVDISLQGDSTGHLPAQLPAVTTEITDTAVVPHRYALNDTDNGYAGAYRGYADYQHEIDVLALHGYNEVLVTVGAEQPYYRALQQFGYTPEYLQKWVPGPEHQPWWLLQNMSGNGGPVTPQLINARATVGRKVCDQLRGLGMTPVLPGYFGTVPPDFAATSQNPGAHVVPQGAWGAGLSRDDWLDPNDPAFAKVAAAYYTAQHDAFGDSTMYKMDPLHEGGTVGTGANAIDLTRAAGAIQRALDLAHPGATWTILSWEAQPQAALLAGVDTSRMLIVDGMADTANGHESSWGSSIPWAFGTIPEYGGNTTLGANTAVWVSAFQQWLTRSGSTLRGIAYMPEASTANPAALALFGDLAWAQTTSPQPVDQKAWFDAYATSRYGGFDPHATAAWDLLRQGPYSVSPTNTASRPGAYVQGNRLASSLISAKPSISAASSGRYPLLYDPATVSKALSELLQVAPSLRTSEAYRYDLVDVARQALVDRAAALLPQIRTAYDGKDTATYRTLVAEWQRNEVTLDQLLGTDTHFMVGPWLAQATAFGHTDAQRKTLEYDARSILTTWVDTSISTSQSLLDYAWRDWSGMVADLYAKRWDGYLASLDPGSGTTTAPDAFTLDDAWARDTTPYPTTPTGDAYAIASGIAGSLPLTTWIQNAGSGGRCADVSGGSDIDSTPTQLHGCNGTPAETWTFAGDSIQAMGKCLDVRGGAVTDGTTVQLYHCNGTSAQRWTYDAATKEIKVSGTEQCLSAANGGTGDGTLLVLRGCTGGGAQQWTHA